MNNYNDYIMLSDRDYEILNKNYDKVLANEYSDLKEIHNKMIEQKKDLESINNNNIYNEIIAKMQENITHLDKLINKNNLINSNQYKSIKNRFNPYFFSLSNENINSAENTEEEYALSPIRSEQEMANFTSQIEPNNNSINNNSNETPRQVFDGNNYNNFPQNTNNSDEEDNFSPIYRESDNNSSNNTDSNIDNSSNLDSNFANDNYRNLLDRENTNSNNKQYNNFTINYPNNADNSLLPNNNNAEQPAKTTTKRNSPMPGNIISNFIKQFNIRFNNNRNNKINTTSEHSKDCDINNKIRQNQCDIIRLLLIYIALRPTIIYTNVLANITMDQFDIYKYMMEK